MDDTINLSVNELMTFASATFDRLLMARMMGQTAYEGDRDYYEVLGYPLKITFSEYMQRYERQDIAARIIELPAKDTWKKPPQISEDDNTETPFVKEWELLVKRLRVWSMLSRADVLSGIGRFGILLIGVRDDKDMKEPVMDIDDPGDSRPLSGQKDILYLRPLAGDETSVEVDTTEKDKKSPRFGLPLTYSIDLASDDQSSMVVHWTRVLHLAENKTHSEIYGLPRLQRVYNRLDDMIKFVGGGSEATWLNMRPGVMIGAKEGFDLGDIEETKTAWLEEIRRYSHDPLRMMRMIGTDVQSLGTGQMMDPTGLFNITLSLISAASGIPQRVLIGSAKGELAAAREDMRQWAGTIAERQTNYAEQEILRPFIDRLVMFGALPMPGVGLDGYDVGTLDNKDVRRWPSLFEQTEAEEAEVRRLDASSTRLVSSPETGEWVATERERRALLGLPEEPEMMEKIESVEDGEFVVQQEGEDGPPRGDFEGQISAAVEPVFAEAQQNAIDALNAGEEPNYDAMREAIIIAIIPILVNAAMFSSNTLEEQFTIFFDDAEIQDQALEWAQLYAPRLADGLVNTTRNVIRKAQARIAEGAPPEEWLSILEQAYGGERARRIGLTETTVGLAFGAILYQRLLRDMLGVNIELTWFTRADERVCPICRPLHETPQTTWSRQFPNGPPAHVNCRCGVVAKRVRGRR